MAAEWIGFAGVIISSLTLVVVAVIQRDAKISQSKNEERAKRRERESRLSMDMMAATLELSDVTAIALSGGKLNGNVEKARIKAAEAKDAYDTFLRDEAARAVAKQ